jgi:hypothetical protein
LSTRLHLADTSYALADGAMEFAVLQGGAAFVLPAGRRVDERALEAAIEKTEDWLMPHAARLRGEVLEIDDATGALDCGMRDVLCVTTRAWSVEDVEGFFLRLVDLATGRVPAAVLDGRHAFIAHVLLLRELAHHGQLREIRLL